MITLHYAPQHNPDPDKYKALSDIEGLRVAAQFHGETDGEFFALNEAVLTSFRHAIAHGNLHHENVRLIIHDKDATIETTFNQYGVPQECHGFMYPNDRATEELIMRAARLSKANREAKIAALRNCKEGEQ